MVQTLINYQIYIIIGICIFPIFAFIIYFAKKMIDRANFVKDLHNMKKPLLERINTIETISEIKEKQEEIHMIMYDIKNDIDGLKKEIGTSQTTLEIEKIDQIEKEISSFYERMQTPTAQDKTKEQPIVAQQTAQQIYEEALQKKQEYEQQTNQQEASLHKQQAKVMNENISKFLLVFKEKDSIIEQKNKSIDEKNKSIYILQQKLNEAEQRIKALTLQHQSNQNKDTIIAEKNKAIQILQQRLQEVENKFRKIALLHKSIAEKEQIKDTIIQEKNEFIANLQYKLSNIEQKLENMITINEDNKEKSLNKKLYDIDAKIQSEKRKNRIFMIVFILFLIVGI